MTLDRISHPTAFGPILILMPRDGSNRNYAIKRFARPDTPPKPTAALRHILD
jgi:hypothetical protein